MNIFRRILNKVKPSDKVNILTPIDDSNGMHVVNQDLEIQSRNSPDVPQIIGNSILDICKNAPEVERCHVLDVHDPACVEEGVKKFIVVSVDCESELETVAIKLQEMLQQHSKFAENCFITSSSTFPDIFEKPEYALYIR